MCSGINCGANMGPDGMGLQSANDYIQMHLDFDLFNHSEEKVNCGNDWDDSNNFVISNAFIYKMLK